VLFFFRQVDEIICLVFPRITIFDDLLKQKMLPESSLIKELNGFYEIMSNNLFWLFNSITEMNGEVLCPVYFCPSKISVLTNCTNGIYLAPMFNSIYTEEIIDSLRKLYTYKINAECLTKMDRPYLKFMKRRKKLVKQLYSFLFNDIILLKKLNQSVQFYSKSKIFIQNSNFMNRILRFGYKKYKKDINLYLSLKYKVSQMLMKLEQRITLTDFGSICSFESYQKPMFLIHGYSIIKLELLSINVFDVYNECILYSKINLLLKILQNTFYKIYFENKFIEFRSDYIVNFEILKMKLNIPTIEKIYLIIYGFGSFCGLDLHNFIIHYFDYTSLKEQTNDRIILNIVQQKQNSRIIHLSQHHFWKKYQQLASHFK